MARGRWSIGCSEFSANSRAANTEEDAYAEELTTTQERHKFNRPERMDGMNSHVSSILLGVNDMERSKRFYTEGLGWEVQDDYRVSVFFVPHGGSLVGFYGRDGLADMVGVSPEGSGFSGVVFNYVVRSEDRVDEVLEEAKRAGGKILTPAAKLKWGGYGGSFADPDGYVWNIGYSAQGKDQPYAE
jgi:predicted enzyme related to lactoylglutathione lyase